MKTPKEIGVPRCTKCGSSQTYVSFRRGLRICRQCGNSEKIKIEEIK